MSNTKFNEILFIIGGFLLALLIIDNANKSRENQALRKRIKESENLSGEIKRQLEELINSNKDVSPEILQELAQIVKLLEINQDTTAILKLAKIIENLLERLYSKTTEFKSYIKEKGHSKPVFQDYLDFAKKEKVVTSEDYHLLAIMKSIRNEEAHSLSIRKEKFSVLAAFIAGIRYVIQFTRLIKEEEI